MTEPPTQSTTSGSRDPLLSAQPGKSPPGGSTITTDEYLESGAQDTSPESPQTPLRVSNGGHHLQQGTDILENLAQFNIHIRSCR